MPPEDRASNPPTRTAIGRLASDMLRLTSGELARLRRMRSDSAGTPTFWRLQHRYVLENEQKAQTLMMIMAIMAPKGDAAHRQAFNDLDRKSALGNKLAEAGYSETRLARFLEMPFEGRADALERMARFLVSKNSLPVDCHDIACLLYADDPAPARKLARDYYQRHYQLQTKEAAR